MVYCRALVPDLTSRTQNSTRGDCSRLAPQASTPRQGPQAGTPKEVHSPELGKLWRDGWIRMDPNGWIHLSFLCRLKDSPDRYFRCFNDSCWFIFLALWGSIFFSILWQKLFFLHIFKLKRSQGENALQFGLNLLDFWEVLCLLCITQVNTQETMLCWEWFCLCATSYPLWTPKNFISLTKLSTMTLSWYHTLVCPAPLPMSPPFQMCHFAFFFFYQYFVAGHPKRKSSKK